MIITLQPGDRRRRQVDRVRTQDRPRDRHRSRRPRHPLHRDLGPLRAPRLPGALGARLRALHLPVPRRRLRPARASRRRDRRRARSTASTRALNGDIVELGPRYSVNSQLRRFSPRDPGEPLDGIGQYLYPSRPERAEARPVQDPPNDAEATRPPAPRRAEDAAAASRGEQWQARPAARSAEKAGIAVVDWVDERTSLSGAARWLMFRKVPKGTNWFYTLGSATMFAFLNQAVTGVFLAMYYRPDPERRRLRIDPPHHQRRVPRAVRARHAQVGRERDGRARVPAHGTHVLLRRLQVPARAQLGDRRGAADPDDGDGLHRLSAAVRSARLLGDDRRRQHQRHRTADRPLPVATSCAAARKSARPRCRASMRSTCC